MTRTITDHEDALIADLTRAEADLAKAKSALNDIKTICRNHDTYNAKTLALMIEQRINRKEAQ